MRSGFGLTPSVRFNRSKFDLGHGVKTTMSVGKLTPIDIQEVLPGDTFKLDLQAVARITTSFLKPVIDNCFMDVYHFFVPLRLVYDDAEKVFGNPNPSAYTDNDLETIPSTSASFTITSGTVGDYLGLPVGIVPKGVSVLPFRAFGLIYDQWFRNENTVDEMYIQKGDTALTEVPNNNAWAPNNYFGKLPNVSKKKDYFTSCLPNPQKGDKVKIGLAETAPLTASSDDLYSVGRILFANQDKSVYPSFMYNDISKSYVGDGSGAEAMTWSNLKVDLQGASAISVSDLRLAFQLQKMLERDALYGSRYNEYLLGHFGVVSPDQRLQFSEYLGGGRIPIQIQQVAQTSQATEDSPLANLGAYSLTNGHSRFSKGFTEHGYIITVACIRTLHTYSQGVPKLFARERREDFYDPLFANLSEQPVYTSELFASSESSLKGNVFGYNEAWAEYRYSPSRISGQLRSNIFNSLDIWHFGEDFANAPVLSEDFTNESATNFDRTLSIPSTEQDNFLCDFWFDMKAIRVMPTYSVPGLIDHH